MPERGADPTNIEVEWQLDAIDLRPVERWLATFPRVVTGSTEGETVVVTVGSRPVTRTVDVYLDTADWRIGRAGFVLRIRRHDNSDEDEVTLKDTSPAIAGLRRRIEVSEPLPVDGLEALGPDGPVGRRLRALAGSTPLGQLLEVRTRRHPYHLHASHGFLGEVDLDDTIIVVGDDQYPVRMRRVEIEAESAWVELLAPLVDQLRRDCSLQPALLSKFEVGLLALGLKVPSLPDLGPTALDAEPSVGSVAYAVLRRHLGSMLAHDAGTRLGEDIEQLHDMRVATRRLRAALALFSSVLPDDARRLRDELGWLATELGTVRDLDVQLERLDGWRNDLPPEERGALADLARLLGRERDVARENLLNCLDSSRYSQLVADLGSLVRPGIGQASGLQVAAAHAPAAAVVPGLILARHRSAAVAARRARRSGEPEDLHRLRILCKRLRYALEFVSEIYDGKTRDVVRRVVSLQDCLGIIQDAQVAATRLHALALTDDSGLSPATVFAMGRVAERYEREAERVAGTLPDHLRALKSPQWQKLKKRMERRRLDAGPPESWSSGPSPTYRSTIRESAADEPASPGPGSQSPPHSPPPPPHSGAVSEDDPDWDDEDAPTLRSVPLGPHSSGPAAPSDGQGSGPRPDDGASAVRRRKEPVFLPAPPSPGRPGPPRSVPRTEPPEDHQNRSFHDHPQ